MPDGSKRWQMVKGASSYCSQSELPVTFGLADQTSVKTLELFWPSGKKQTLQNVKANQTLTVHE